MSIIVRFSYTVEALTAHGQTITQEGEGSFSPGDEVEPWEWDEGLSFSGAFETVMDHFYESEIEAPQRQGLQTVTITITNLELD
jgi:hypothetical protein